MISKENIFSKNVHSYRVCSFKCRHSPSQLRMATNIQTATYVDYIDDIYIDDMRSGLLPTLPDEYICSRAQRVICFRF